MTNELDISQRLGNVEGILQQQTELMREVRDSIRENSQQISELKQTTHGHAIQSDENLKRIEQHAVRIAAIERSSDQQSGSIGAVKGIGILLFGVLSSAVGWLLSIVLSTQSSNQVHQTRLDRIDADSAAITTRIQTLEGRKP